ncbi:MAG: helix-turn-helix domain-containing protein [Candidatus Dojkabacteria bacterium]|nr:MAG: helix-turn-helix domain-containing protein [Candidatus Dojkabacteria bacterium]
MDTQTYQTLYLQGLPYFSEEVTLVQEALQRKQCVAFCSAYKMGDRRFLDYLYSIFQHSGEYDVYYDHDDSFTAQTLDLVQKKESTRQKLLLVPWYFRKEKSFTSAFTRYMRNKSNTFLSLIILEASYFDTPEKVFSHTSTPVEVILTRKPLSKENSKHLLDVREQLYGKKLPPGARKTILSLTNGHIGLTKRLFLLAQQKHPLTIPKLLHEPTIRAELLQLELEYRTLSRMTTERIGLTTENGVITIPLLKAFVKSLAQPTLDQLSPLYQELLELFLQQPGKFLSKEAIHAHLNQQKPYSLWAVYKTMSRFGKAIQEKYMLRTISGKGYKLISAT